MNAAKNRPGSLRAMIQLLVRTISRELFQGQVHMADSFRTYVLVFIMADLATSLTSFSTRLCVNAIVCGPKIELAMGPIR